MIRGTCVYQNRVLTILIQSCASVLPPPPREPAMRSIRVKLWPEENGPFALTQHFPHNANSRMRITTRRQKHLMPPDNSPGSLHERKCSRKADDKYTPRKKYHSPADIESLSLRSRRLLTRSQTPGRNDARATKDPTAILPFWQSALKRTPPGKPRTK